MLHWNYFEPFFGSESVQCSWSGTGMKFGLSFKFRFWNMFLWNSAKITNQFQFEMIARNREEGSKSVYIGAACYPTLAMFNHSCDPSIIR